MEVINNVQVSVKTPQVSNTKTVATKSTGSDSSQSFKDILNTSSKSNSLKDSNNKFNNDDSTRSVVNVTSQKDNKGKVNTKDTDNSSSDVKNSTKEVRNSSDKNVSNDSKKVEKNEDEKSPVIAEKSKVEDDLSNDVMKIDSISVLASLLTRLLLGTNDNSKTTVQDTKSVSETNESKIVDEAGKTIEQALEQLLRSSNIDLNQVGSNVLDFLQKSQNSAIDVSQLFELLNINNSTTSIGKSLGDNTSTSIGELLVNNQAINVEDLKKNNLSLDSTNKVVAIQEQFKNVIEKISKLTEQVVAKGENSEQLVSLKETLETIKTVLQTVDGKVSNKDSTNNQNSTFKQIVAEINNNLTKIDETNTAQNNSSFNSNQSNNKSATKSDFIDTASKQVDNSEESSDDTVLNKILNTDNDNSKFSTIANRLTEFKTIDNLPKVEAPVVNRFTMAEDIVKSVKYMQSNDMKELVVKVNPGTLGEITIKLVAQGETMKANLQVSSKDTYNLINSQEIKNALSNENIKVTEVNISLYNEDTTLYRNQSGFEDQSSKGNKENRKNSNQTDENVSADILDEGEVENTGLSSLNIFV